jgi:FkbM family methyltransferase
LHPKGYFSQNEEEEVLIDYFGNRIGMFLDIGAFDGKDLSNTHKLALNGWEGICIEPSPQVFPALANLYKDNDRVLTINCAIGGFDGKLDFYDNPGALASALKEHVEKWKNYDPRFDLIEVDCLSWDSFYSRFPYDFNFISIDTEGLDWEILKQIDLKQTNTELICVEYSYNKDLIFNYLYDNGFVLIHKNAENVIMKRK